MNPIIISLISAFLFFLQIPISAQDRYGSSVSDKIHDLYHRSTPNADETYRLGTQILKLARTTREHSYGYSLLADGLYKKEDYSRALVYYKKVDSVSILLGDLERRFMTNLFMTGIYNKVGLVSKADESLSLCKMLKEQTEIDYANYYLLTAEAYLLEISFKYCQAIPKRKRLVEEIRAITEKESSDRSLLVASHAQLAYDYIKCEQLFEANLHIKEADHIIEIEPNINSSIIMAMYKMVKGSYAAETGDIALARVHFDEALRNATKNDLQIEKIKVLEERLNYNFDGSPVRKQLFKKLNALRLKRKLQAAKIIEQEQAYKNTIIASKDRQLRSLITMILTFVIMVALAIRVTATKRKASEKKVKELLENLRSRNVELERNNTQVLLSMEKIEKAGLPLEGNSQDKITHLSTKRMISEEKENELLTKLIFFETGKDFLNSNFSISMMAAQFGTNSKYINYMLQKHRDKLFSDYINALRISYITRLLYQEPAYLNYKISYLSELCGYSSHSRFTSIFKKETGISPSDLISQLLKENASSN